MGLPSGISRSSYDFKEEKLPNPDPCNYEITAVRYTGKYLIISINYPDCTNYEGNKILVYKNVDIEHLEAQQNIDPHFSENKKFHSPIARFRPDTEGWDMATTFVLAMKEAEK